MPELEREIDRSISLPKVYKQVVNFAVKHDGVFSLSEYQNSLNEIYTAEKYGDKASKLIKRELNWKRTTINNMISDGTLTRVSNDVFRLNQNVLDILNERSPPKKEFKLGKNHLKLLQQNFGGIITFDSLNNAIKSKGKINAEREQKFQKGMLKNLTQNGYLEKLPDGSFKILQKGMEALHQNYIPDNDQLKILKLEKSGVISANALNKSSNGNEKNRQYQNKNLKALLDGGMLIQDKSGLALTPKAKELLLDSKQAEQKQESVTQSAKTLRIYLQDSIFECLSLKNKFTLADVEAQSDSAKIKRRLKTLISRGFILECKNDTFELTPEFRDRLKVEKNRSVFRPVKLDTEFLKLSNGVRFEKEDILKHPKRDELGKRLETLLCKQCIREEFGGYTITDSFRKTLENIEKKDSVTVTRFDAAFCELAPYGRLSPKAISEHPRAASLYKRLDTLTEYGLIKPFDGKEYLLSPELINRLEVVKIRNIDRSISLDVFTKEQKALLSDMCIFSQLTEWQIFCYIYGRKRALMNGDLKWLTSKKVIEYDPIQKVYTPTSFGTIFARELAGKEKYYKSKAKSRPEEIAHDVLVYEAYHRMVQMLSEQGIKVTYVKTDRELRSEFGKVPFASEVIGDIPDLKIYYKDKEGKDEYKSIEIDCGYNEKTIEKKLKNLTHNGEIYWFSNSESNALKAAKIAVKLGFRVVRGFDKPKSADTLHVAKTLYVNVIDENDDEHKVAFKEGRKFNAFAKPKHTS